MKYTKITNSVRGNPRYVFSPLLFDSDYEKAFIKAKSLGFKKYKQGYFVAVSYNIQETIKDIKAIQDAAAKRYTARCFKRSLKELLQNYGATIRFNPDDTQGLNSGSMEIVLEGRVINSNNGCYLYR